MTPTEAIKELRDASDNEVRYGDTEHNYNEVMQRIEAFELAIKALKQTRYKSEARRWKRRYLDLKHRIFKLEGQQQKWIQVSEKLPEERYAVLVWCPERKNTYCAYLEEGQWWIFGAYFEKVKLEVTAWMPLPEGYTESEE